MLIPNCAPHGSIVGHGIDAVDIHDFMRLVTLIRQDSQWRRYYTLTEWANADSGRNVERLASRFAIKEATLKALGVGWGGGIAYTDVEVVTLANGAPSVALHRKVLGLAAELGAKTWFVSASHTRTLAIASVLAASKMPQSL